MTEQPNEYDVWIAAVATGTGIPAEHLHDSQPLSGRYKYKSRKTGEWVPVAYWLDGEGKMVCRYGNTMLNEQRANEIWQFASKNPISNATYKERISTGRWPGESDAAAEDRKNTAAEGDPETVEALADRIERLAIEAEAMIGKGAAPSQDEADRAADLAERLGKMENLSVEKHKVEKAVHLEAGRKVDGKWFPLRDRAMALKKRLKDLCINPFLTKKNAEIAARHREEQDRALTTGTPVTAPPPKASAGSVGRKVTQRKVVSGEIVDVDAFFAVVKTNAKVLEALQDVANASARAGITLAGMKIVDGNKAA